MANSLANQLMKNEIEALAQQVFPGKKKVYMRAAKALLNGVVATGRTLLCKLAETLPKGETSLKGRQELLSGWLWSHDFCTPIRDYLWQNACALTQRDSIIAIDATDISKAYGGRGIEGMAMGWDGSRKVNAMGYDALRRAHACADGEKYHNWHAFKPLMRSIQRFRNASFKPS